MDSHNFLSREAIQTLRHSIAADDGAEIFTIGTLREGIVIHVKVQAVGSSSEV